MIDLAFAVIQEDENGDFKLLWHQDYKVSREI
jgi:hypothetical protein